jgi:hypothetical protein
MYTAIRSGRESVAARSRRRRTSTVVNVSFGELVALSQFFAGRGDRRARYASPSVGLSEEGRSQW